MTTGQSAAPSVGNVQPQQQKKEKHLVHWFRKGRYFLTIKKLKKVFKLSKDLSALCRVHQSFMSLNLGCFDF